MVLTVGDNLWGAVFKIQCAFPNIERRACLNKKLWQKLEENKHDVKCSLGVISESRVDAQI